MCDMRNIIGVVIDGEVIQVDKTSGHYHGFSVVPDKLDPGLYAIGASGVGMYYYDGQNWYSDYEYNMYDPINQCKFITDGSMDLLIDIKEYKPDNE